MFEWKNSYSVNVKEIDLQHQKLFEIGSRLYDIVSLKDDTDHYDEITAILEELFDYTVYHFGFEENLMKEKNYSEYEKHKIEHDFFIKRIRKIGNTDLDQNQNESMMKIVEFVADWISGHILETDAQYIAFFKEKGIQ